MEKKRIGVIGGSGLYHIGGLKDVKEIEVDTPFGRPSDKYLLGRLEEREVVFLSRHKRGHKIMPSELNFRANIYGMKKLGVEWLISVSAVGSMKEEIKPGDIVIPDQFFDRTKSRPSTFFGDGIVGHVSMANPVCSQLADILYYIGKNMGISIHRGGTYLCIEGPQFSTKAESRIYRQWGVDVIGMTNIPEAKLAREAEICYATLALSTDYDCWHETEEDVTVEQIIKILMKNVKVAKSIIKEAMKRIPVERECSCAKALENAVITSPKFISKEEKERLSLIIGRYLKEDSE